MICALAVSAIAGLLVATNAGADQGASTTYVVVYKTGASAKAAKKAVEAAGGKVVGVTKEIGVASVTSTNKDFITAVSRKAAIAGAARNSPIGYVKPDASKRMPFQRDDAGLTASASASRSLKAAADITAEPLSGEQWDMKMIHATTDGSYAVNPGNKGVLVGIMDTGIDGHHPDIAPNFDAALSRNFTTDIPLIDGPCEDETDAQPTSDPCVDPSDVDDDGHGTHVASTVASPLNGIGIGGVAPNVTLVNIRAGQDSGYFFLQPTLNAMVYAADVGIDVVNMSFYTDPWLYNCASNPADSPQEQYEQRTVITATQRAINYGTRHNVTFISAAGNENTDLSNPTEDDTSPDFPPDAAHPRVINNSCVSVPTETQGVLAVSAVGKTGRKSFFSNWGLGDIDVAAPGGDSREFFGTPDFRVPENSILAAYPENVGRDAGDIDADGNVTTPFVVKDTSGGVNSYYQWIQGTSMASPHAVGVAALIVSQFGKADKKHGGLTMLPRDVRKQLLIRATDHACPTPRTFVYPFDVDGTYTATCEGGTKSNSFYGQGIVDALASLSKP